MKMISLWVLVFTFAVGAVYAQSSATQQQIDTLTGKIQELTENQLRQTQRLEALAKEISELREKVNAPQINDSASRDDLKKLAEKVQEVDRKRQDDAEVIRKSLAELGKVIAEPAHPVKPRTPPKKNETADVPATPEKGYEYEVKEGDTLGLIVKAYRAQGVKVTKTQIIAANPKINPDVLIPGKKIFIPDANAK